MMRKTGRAATKNPPNRFESIHIEDDLTHLCEGMAAESTRKTKTEFFVDEGRTLIRENQSSDLPFRYSVNPYRGCEHGCAYCYARPGHETLGLGAGLDFETKILVKQSAAKMLRRELNHSKWRGEPITLSGVTDCYQPVERHRKITRALLEVLVEARQAFSIVTKNALVTRDLDLLTAAARLDCVHVFLSITSLRHDLTRELEPRTSAPAARLRAIEALAEACVPVGVMVSPVIPALNDEEVPAVLQAASQAGAQSAATILLRLPLSVRPVFESWLEQRLPPTHARRVLSRIRACRDAKHSDSRFGTRMRGTGPYAESLRTTFAMFAARYGLDRGLPPLNTAHFRPPANEQGQTRLF
jgi:DNA repair photolyase